MLWFGDMPQEPECSSPAWLDDFEAGDPWLEVRKQQLPKFPEPPAIILPWIDQEALRRASGEMPALRPNRLVADVTAEIAEDEEPPRSKNLSVITRRLRRLTTAIVPPGMLGVRNTGGGKAYNKCMPNFSACTPKFGNKARS